MKKLLSLTVAVALTVAMTACGNNNNTAAESTTPAASVESSVAAPETSVASSEAAPVEEEVKVMTFAEYAAAELDTPVVVETYVQATQSWWNDKITVYTQNEDGAIFLYEMACSKEDSEKLVPGTKIRVSGYKSAWSGEVEIIEATFEILDGSYIAPVTDVTALMGDEDALLAHQNEFVSFTDLTIVANDQNTEAFYLGSDAADSDLYFCAADENGNTYTFCDEYYLCNETTEVYGNIKNLFLGDKVDIEGYLYWYNGMNVHVTSVTIK